MRPPSIGSVLALGWVIAEVIAYIVFFSFFSLGAGLVVGVVSAAIGILVLRRMGQQIIRIASADLQRLDLRRMLGSAPLAMIGAVLLVAPGFLSDLAGLILVLAGSRSLFRPPPERLQRDIDLDPGEWRRTPDDPRSP
jgi:UPF0716 protein FxsA